MLIAIVAGIYMYIYIYIMLIILISIKITWQACNLFYFFTSSVLSPCDMVLYTSINYKLMNPQWTVNKRWQPTYVTLHLVLHVSTLSCMCPPHCSFAFVSTTIYVHLDLGEVHLHIVWKCMCLRSLVISWLSHQFHVDLLVN